MEHYLSKGERIAKIIARAGIASRRDAERMIDHISGAECDQKRLRYSRRKKDQSSRQRTPVVVSQTSWRCQHFPR